MEGRQFASVFKFCYTVRIMERLTLKEEVKLLRSAVIGLVGEDKEGTYRPEFVEEMFASLSDKPEFVFSSPEQFLTHLKKDGKRI